MRPSDEGDGDDLFRVQAVKVSENRQGGKRRRPRTKLVQMAGKESGFDQTYDALG